MVCVTKISFRQSQDSVTVLFSMLDHRARNKKHLCSCSGNLMFSCNHFSSPSFLVNDPGETQGSRELLAVWDFIFCFIHYFNLHLLHNLEGCWGHWTILWELANSARQACPFLNARHLFFLFTYIVYIRALHLVYH